MEKNRGIAFYENMWTAVESFPEEQQMQAVWAIVKYGITGEMVDPAKYPIGAMAAGMVKPSIDNSTLRFNNNAMNGEKGGRPIQATDEEIKQYLIENPTATSAQVAEAFSMSASAIQKREVWKNRKMLAAGSVPAVAEAEKPQNFLINDKENASKPEKPKFDF